jgi:hypothetical protein
MRCEQIKSLDADTLFQILELASRIDSTFTLKEYGQYLTDYLPSGCIGLFGIFDQEKIVGFVQTQIPHPLDPKTGFIHTAANIFNPPKSVCDKALSLAEQWLKLHGASKWRTYSKRKPRLWKRRYNIDCIGKAGDEYVLEKLI